jgi:hypothetical protein
MKSQVLVQPLLYSKTGAGDAGTIGAAYNCMVWFAKTVSYE